MSLIISEILQKKAEKSLVNAVEQVEEFFQIMLTQPLLTYTQKGKIAGTAWFERWEIRLNPILYQENEKVFLREVIPHELAHLVAYQLSKEGVFKRKIRPHGKEWRLIMEEVFSLPANVNHTLKTHHLMKEAYLYACQCRQHYLSKIRHLRTLKGRVYLCQQCKGTLNFIKLK